MPTRLQSFSNILLSRCSRLSCVTEKRRALLSLPGNRTRSSTGGNQAVSGPAALVGIRNGGREGIRPPGFFIANSGKKKQSKAAQILNQFHEGLNWQNLQTGF